MDLKEYIKSKRESLSDSSLTTYASLLKNLYIKVFGNDKKMDFDNFNKVEPILEYLKDFSPNRRKTTLSALVIITDNKKYRDLMLDDVKKYNGEISKQEKTETQKENWLTQDELNEMYNAYKKEANTLYKKQHLTNADLQQIQKFIMLAVFKLIPPRRSKDYCDFKIKNINKEKDNYMGKGEFVFNSFKTAKFYGQQKVDIPRELTAIINKWIKINPTEYLLFDVNMNPLTPVKLNQRFNKIFDGKKIAINALRHSYLTDKYAEEMKKNSAMAEDMAEMGSSMSQAKVYIKTDD